MLVDLVLLFNPVAVSACMQNLSSKRSRHRALAARKLGKSGSKGAAAGAAGLPGAGAGEVEMAEGGGMMMGGGNDMQFNPLLLRGASSPSMSGATDGADALVSAEVAAKTTDFNALVGELLGQEAAPDTTAWASIRMRIGAMAESADRLQKENRELHLKMLAREEDSPSGGRGAGASGARPAALALATRSRRRQMRPMRAGDEGSPRGSPVGGAPAAPAGLRLSESPLRRASMAPRSKDSPSGGAAGEA